MQKTINGAIFRKMIVGAYNYLDTNKKYIDSLNVFPVPDGDTGNNMFLTMKAAANEVNNCSTNNMDALGEAFSKGALRGARGNSGVILSQIIRGMASELMLQPEMTTKTFASAMKNGSRMAYKAVSIPKEGTILTVIRVMSEAAESAAKKYSDFEDFFKQILTTGEEILEQTQEMMPILKAAGVVDAGGRGVLTVFHGFYKGLTNDGDLTMELDETVKKIEEVEQFHINFEDLAEIEFGYCTEFKIIHINKKTTESDIDKIREKLMAIGDSVICVGDLSMIKIHVHTNEPNRALGYALELGEIYDVKIENMLEQNRELKKKHAQMQQSQKAFGMVAIAAGSGIGAVFKDLGADHIIEGGQTMNPSANDIVQAADRVPSDHVFVFPNNKNIILAANKAKEIVNKPLFVVPTREVTEGISAVLAFNPDATAEENVESMMSQIDVVKSGQVTHAVRNTQLDGFDVKNGDIIGIFDSKIVAKGVTHFEAIKDMMKIMIDKTSEIVTIYYGDGVSDEDCEKLVGELEVDYPDIEFTYYFGGQPHYYYFVAVE